MKPELVHISTIEPSTYNPRKADRARLDLVALSLRKLGFVLPLYAVGREIVSGHQRHAIAAELGWTHVPLCLLPEMGLPERQALNLLFNQATNDMARTMDRSEILGLDARIAELAAQLPDVEGDGRYPCMVAKSVPTIELVKANAMPPDYMRMVGASLYGHGIAMPIVVDSGLRVINGLGRMAGASAKGHEAIEVVMLDDEQAEFAGLMLNKLSMDFDLDRYADQLRHNALRRGRSNRESLSQCTTLPMRLACGGKGRHRAKDFDETNPEHVTAWKSVHGLSVVDFGAGKGDDTARMRSMGVHVASFEPFVPAKSAAGKWQPYADVEKSRELARVFLDDVASGKPYTSVFCSTVLNSVPFEQDRRHVLAILAALTGAHRCYITTKSTAHTSWINNATEIGNEAANSKIGFRVDHEPGAMLTEYSGPQLRQVRPKLQKYHTAAEFYALCKLAFRTVNVRAAPAGTLLATCADPAVTEEQLAAALRFEFDLPYHDGTRMGLAERAVDSFRIRLAVL